jgi:hypothetical protein
MKFTTYLKIGLVLLVLSLFTISIVQHYKIVDLKHTVEVVENNSSALADSLTYYQDSNGNLNAEKQALILTVKDVRDSLELEKNKEPITVVKYNTIIKEVVVSEPIFVQDTLTHQSQIVWSEYKDYGKSSFAFDLSIPCTVQDSTILLGNSSLSFEQNIWCVSTLEYDKKTNRLYVHIITDYPNTKFNGAQGILVEDSEPFRKLQYNARKNWGIGFQVGYGLTGNSFSTYIGIGLSYQPRWLQF